MRIRALITSLTLLGLVLPAQADDPTVPRLAKRVSESATLHGALQLSLADAIAMGLENNLNVEIQRHAPIIARADYRAAWGAYDPTFQAEFGYADIENPNANLIIGVSNFEQQTLDGFGGFRGTIPWLNTQYDARLTSSRLETNSGIALLSPEFTSEVSFAVTQPLMRGLIWNQPWTQVRTSRVLEIAALEQFRADVMDTVRQIEDAYWTLIADEERVRVAEKSLETSQALLDQVNTQYEVGVVSKVEIAESEAGVAEREFDLIQAQNTYRNSMDLLIDLVLGPNLTPDSRIAIAPTDRADEYIQYEVDVEEAAEIAFTRRPEIAIADHTITRLQYQLKSAKNDRLPQLDAQLSYGNRGLAGSARPGLDTCFGIGPEDFPTFPGCDPANMGVGAVPPPPTPTPYGDTFRNPGRFFGPNAAEQWSARAIISIPFPNTTGRANVSKAELELRRARVQKRRTEQDVILEIRRSARDLTSAQEGIEAAERRRAAAQEQLRAEEIRLEYGESTPFDVLQREEDLVSAEQGYIGAFQRYRTSLTGLDRAQGTILRNRNIEIDRVAPLR